MNATYDETERAIHSAQYQVDAAHDHDDFAHAERFEAVIDQLVARRDIVCPSCGGAGDIENMAGRCADCETDR